MNETPEQNTPSERQRKYLGRLLAKAHEHGVPYLPTEQLTRAQVSAWIEYLKLVVGEEVDAVWIGAASNGSLFRDDFYCSYTARAISASAN
jgi:hypothetical protein